MFSSLRLLRRVGRSSHCHHRHVPHLSLIRALGRSVKTKDTTGLAGLPVIENAHEVFTALNKKILEEAESLPERASSYRDFLGRFAGHRLKVCETYSTVEGVEKAISTGEIEELIEEAEDELKVIQMMKDWTPGTHWEVPEEFKEES